MATIERRLGAWLLLLLMLVLGSTGCGRAPAMGDDREVFTTIDALYTGISLRDATQVDRCARTLDQLKEAGRLPVEAHEAISRLVAQSRDGQWETAQSDLRRFMLDQRQ